MAVFAATGAFLSCFHQGSLGGVAGVMFGRLPLPIVKDSLSGPGPFFSLPGLLRPYGPCFTLTVLKIFEGITKKKLVKDNVVHLLAKISGWMITTYIIAKIIDTIYWAQVTAPSMGFTVMEFYSDNAFYGIWILVVEILICGIVPAVLLIRKGFQGEPETSSGCHSSRNHRSMPQPLGHGCSR